METGKVVRALENKFAGVDIITTDPATSLKASGGKLLEVNPDPGLHHHYITPEDSQRHEVAVKILKYLLSIQN